MGGLATVAFSLGGAKLYHYESDRIWNVGVGVVLMNGGGDGDDGLPRQDVNHTGTRDPVRT
jgi:hypothetical protein